MLSCGETGQSRIEAKTIFQLPRAAPYKLSKGIDKLGRDTATFEFTTDSTEATQLRRAPDFRYHNTMGFSLSRKEKIRALLAVFAFRFGSSLGSWRTSSRCPGTTVNIQFRFVHYLNDNKSCTTYNASAVYSTP